MPTRQKKAVLWSVFSFLLKQYEQRTLQLNKRVQTNQTAQIKDLELIICGEAEERKQRHVVANICSV